MRYGEGVRYGEGMRYGEGVRYDEGVRYMYMYDGISKSDCYLYISLTC